MRIGILGAVMGLAMALTAPSPAHARGFDIRLPPDFTIDFTACPDTGYAITPEGCTYPDGQIYVLADAPDFTVWHELGHVFDFEILKPADRAWFMRAFRTRGSWDDAVDFDGQPIQEPIEMFADEYAACALGLPHEGDANSWWTLKRHQRICARIERIGRDRGASRS